MINSRKIEDLDLPARQVCNAHVIGCKAAGIELLITSTYRDGESQADLYAIGRTKDVHRKPVTNAKPGKSWHQYRCSWDCVPLIGGKAIWDDESLWKDVIRIGKAAGAEAGAEWKTFVDKPHFQFTGEVKTLSAALDRFKENGTIFL